MSKFTGLYELYLALKSEGTRDTYAPIYAEWESFIGEDKVFEAEQGDVWRYVAHLKAKEGENSRIDGKNEFSWVTVKKYLAGLKGLYSYLLEMKIVNINPFLGHELKFSKRKVPQKRPTQSVPFERVPELIYSPGLTSKEGVRDCTIMNLLFYGGLRVSEACKLMVSDIQITPLNTMFLRLRNTKAGDTVNHTLPDDCTKMVTKYYEQRRQEGAKPEDPFFVAYRGIPRRPGKRALHRRSVYDLFKFYCKAIGLVGDYSPHSARATAVTKALNDGMSYREVQEFSRHSSIQMVEIYDKRHFSVDRAPQKKLRY